jgi:hypothetical protein
LTQGAPVFGWDVHTRHLLLALGDTDDQIAAILPALTEEQHLDPGIDDGYRSLS